jgi:RNA polymerase sigma-B factor
MDVQPRATSIEDQRDATRRLFDQLGGLGADDPCRSDLRDQLVELHLPLAHHLARRYRDRGEPLDDLIQVGTIGLIKAVDRFETERGVEFSTYATPTIIGEIKRHFRDKGWAIRVPRRLQELRISLAQATAELAQANGRSPTIAELAKHVGVGDDEVLEGLESAGAYSTLSLDAPEQGETDSVSMAGSIGIDDEGLTGVEHRESLRPLLSKLPERERQILLLRFFGELTQSQIAEQVGISQMHVSRLLAKTLTQLRSDLLED